MMRLLVAAAVSLATSVAIAADAPKIPLLQKNSSNEVKRNAWSFGFSGMRQNLKASDGNEIIGNSGAIQLGTGYISDSWYLDTSFDIILGPYEPAHNSELDVDYVGTGFTVWTGLSAQAENLRSTVGGYGFALGLSYADTAGKMNGINRRDSGRNTPDDAKLIDDFTMRVTNFSLLPAIFFSWLDEARPKGNSPDLLMTRVEGYILTLGAAMPLMVTYQTKYATGDGANVTQGGKLRGYSVLVSLKAMFGT